MSTNRTALDVLSGSPGWAKAVAELSQLAAHRGEQARDHARGYGRVYAGRRGSMLVDVVASRQRRYAQRVLPTVERWEASTSDHSLRALAVNGLDARTFGLKTTEAVTIQLVASNLSALACESELDEDDACRLWATNTEGVEHAPDLDPVVGGVKGIGPALFAYARMRSGANAIKVDVRVKKSLRAIGFRVPPSDHASLIIAHAAAEAIGVDLLVLDQLLWHADGVTS